MKTLNVNRNVTTMLYLSFSLAAGGCLGSPSTEVDGAGVNAFDPSSYQCGQEDELMDDCVASCEADRKVCAQDPDRSLLRCEARLQAARDQVDWSAGDGGVAADIAWHVSEIEAMDCNDGLFGLAQLGAEELARIEESRSLTPGTIVDSVLLSSVVVFDAALCGIYRPLAIVGVALGSAEYEVGVELVETIVQVWYEIQRPFQELRAKFAQWGCDRQYYMCAQAPLSDSDADGIEDLIGCPGLATQLDLRCSTSQSSVEPGGSWYQEE